MPQEVREEILKAQKEKKASLDTIGITVHNRADKWFVSWVSKMRETSEEELVDQMKRVN